MVFLFFFKRGFCLFKVCTTLFDFISCGVLLAYVCVRALDPLELELEAVVSCHVGAGS